MILQELTKLNQTLTEEYTKATRLLACSIEHSNTKDSQIQKLQLAVKRLESLCRCLQEKVRVSQENSNAGVIPGGGGLLEIGPTASCEHAPRECGLESTNRGI